MSDTQKLYFCDGNACDEHNKQYCYKNGGDCYYTPHAEHSLSKLIPDFPPTSFHSFGSTEILMESFNEEKIFSEFKNGKKLVLK